MTIVDTPRAGRRQWIGLAVLALPCLLYAMDLTVLNLAVPHLTAALRPSSTQLLWIVDIYGFLLAGSLITMGTLGDRIGRRRLLLVGAAAFGVASVLAASATSAEQLIAARALLGVAGATLAPSTLSLLRTMFPDQRQRTAAIGVWGASLSAGGAIGPLLGGLLLERFWWGSVFLVAVPPMVLLLVLGPRLLPEFRDPDAGRLDIPSAALSLAAVLGVIYGLKQLAQNGLGWPPALSILAGLTVGVLFVRRQQTLTDPLIDLRLFRTPAFSTAVATNTLGIFVMFGTFPFIAQYLQLVVGLSPLQAGLWLLPSGGAAILGSILVPVVLRRVRPVSAMVGGLVFMAVGVGLLTRINGAAGLAMVVAASVAMPLASGLVFLPATGLVVGAAPPQRAGAAAAISQTGWEFGGALGIAVLGSIGIALYRSGMADVVPAGVAPQAAAAARDTLGGAVGVAVRLPADLDAALLDAARASFTQGLHVAAAVSIAVAVGLAIVVAVRLRERPGAIADVRPDPELEEPPQRAAGSWRAQTSSDPTVRHQGNARSPTRHLPSRKMGRSPDAELRAGFHRRP
jgi:MFS transporter, DHA2 family, multidrug resistance protein